MSTLTITEPTLRRILAAARAADHLECMGLLAAAPAASVVTAMYQLPASASMSHATAAPVAIKQGAEEIRADKLVPRGLWHSHGHGHVFHSATDQATLHRLLPAMAAWSFERPPAALRAPAVTAPDTAVLPLGDGQVWHFCLRGAALAGLDAHEPAAWDGIETLFVPAKDRQRALLEATHLALEGGGVVVRLGIPEGAAVTCRKEDHAPFRSARLYSLVVNSAGDTCAECLVIHDLAGHCFITQEACSLEVREDDHGAL